jgi:hypothetical protein
VRNEEEKAQIEIKVFSDFICAANIDVDPNSIRKGNAAAGEPDIYCEIEGSPVYFELTEACAPDFAATITKSRKAVEPKATWGGDVSVQTVQKKLGKTYNVSTPIELLLYTAGRTVLPDDVIAAQVEPILANGLGSFRRVWLFGDHVKCMACNS